MAFRLHSAAFIACAGLLWSAESSAQMPVTWQSGNAPSRPEVEAQRDSAAEARDAKMRRKAWMLSVEGVTHAPIDVGLSVAFEAPPGLRVSGGYGWVPGSYMDLLTNVAASASEGGYARALLERADYEGHTWRLQVGVRPFRSLGLYADVGYLRLDATGSLDLADSGIEQLEALRGGYRAHTKLDMWLVELGYQAQVADRLVFALGLGAIGTLSSTTTISAIDGARTNKYLGTVESETDAALEKYGIVPTLTLRVGFDLI
jgi:hypothetical protein